ncbi:putative RNA methyltransferase [Salinibius halmophilus]|uniref:putative RNA methyltransferase n=1 Tax=Salinibius halmophilus TaxID=1853216 RepID=UPI000E666D71|nr:methyltransferase domain-containing protein [Salinibius halmophilus]
MPIAFICPHCQAPLQPSNSQWCCSNQHSFDVAKQGHINLLAVQQKRSKQPGDSKEMVAARRAWLAKGYYQPIANALSELIENNSTVLDAGCGEGYYLSQLLAAKNIDAVGNDISKFAAAVAAKQCPAAQILVASNKALPIAEHSFDYIVCAFGFPVWHEFQRLLKPGGKLVLVNSTNQHLYSLRAALYEQVIEKPEAQLPAFLTCEHEQVLTYSIEGLDASEVQALAVMTPHWFRAKQAAREALIEQPPSAIEVSVRLQVCQFNASADTAAAPE